MNGRCSRNLIARLLVFTLPLSILCGCYMNSRALSQSPRPSPTVTKESFGSTKIGVPVDQYILSSGSGVTASIITYGGIIRSLTAPGRDGRVEDIVLGYDSLGQYEARHPYFGTITGRFANRIAKGSFSLDGKTYTLATNNGPNHLHGGINGFDRAVWKAESSAKPDSVSLQLSHVSPDGDEGYPGTLDVTVTYTLFSNNTLRIDYSATTDKATPINLTSHSYFNLKGHASGDVLNQKIQIYARSIVPVDGTLIPTGDLQSVDGTPFDFRNPEAIGSRISQVEPGYDHTFVLQDSAGLKKAALAWDPDSGRALEVVTSQPGLQFYTGNFLDGSEKGKDGTAYNKYSGFCLETQHFPDSPNQRSFPSTILRPGDTYQHSTLFKFGILDYGN